MTPRLEDIAAACQKEITGMVKVTPHLIGRLNLRYNAALTLG